MKHDYKVEGEANRDGIWRKVSTVIHNVSNEKIAIVRATAFMHKVRKVIRLK